MAVKSRRHLIKLCNELDMELIHFAMGTYPTGLNMTALPVNRLLFIIENPNGKNNYIKDSNRKIIFKEGHSYFCPAFHKSIVKLDDKLTFVSIQFKLELFKGIDVFSRQHDISEEYNLKFVKKAQTIFMNERNELLLATEVKNLIFTFAVLLLNRMNDEAIRLVSTFAVYQDVVNFITENCHAGITVNDMAQVMNMRREVFTRRFTLDTGIAPKKIFNRFLLNKATKLLLQPHVTVREVAYELKFSSEYYFSRFFKRHTGIPPKQFQKLDSS